MKREQEIRERAKKIAAKFGTTHEQREDIEGRCLEAAWKAETKIKEEQNPIAYLHRAMTNTALDYLKEQPKQRNFSLDEALSTTENFEDSLLDKIVLKERIPAFISSLKSPDKEILSLLLRGHSIDEIGKLLNMRPNTVTVRIRRHKKVWKEQLEHEEEKA